VGAAEYACYGLADKRKIWYGLEKERETNQIKNDNLLFMFYFFIFL